MFSAIENFTANFTAKMSGQPLDHAALRSIQEFDGNDKAATMPWLDQVELVGEKQVMPPVKVSISKLKGLALSNINKIRKEEGLTCINLSKH